MCRGACSARVRAALVASSTCVPTREKGQNNRPRKGVSHKKGEKPANQQPRAIEEKVRQRKPTA